MPEWGLMRAERRADISPGAGLARSLPHSMTTTVETPLAGAGAAHGAGAITAAVEQALAALHGGRPAAVLVFPTAADDLVSDLALAQTLTAAPLVGMTGNATLARDGAHEGACSALALAAPLQVAVRVEPDAS